MAAKKKPTVRSRVKNSKVGKRYVAGRTVRDKKIVAAGGRGGLSNKRAAAARTKKGPTKLYRNQLRHPARTGAVVGGVVGALNGSQAGAVGAAVGAGIGAAAGAGGGHWSARRGPIKRIRKLEAGRKDNAMTYKRRTKSGKTITVRKGRRK